MRQIDVTLWEVVKHRCTEARYLLKKHRPLLAWWEMGYARGQVMALGQEEGPLMLAHLEKVIESFKDVRAEIHTALDFYHRTHQEQDRNKLADGILRDLRGDHAVTGSEDAPIEAQQKGIVDAGGGGHVHSGDA